jgi:hypothetical protein
MTTADYEASLADQARELADAMTEAGLSVARLLLGSACTAGLDPAVFAPLTGAALALGADQLTVYTAEGPAHPDDVCFLADVCDAEDDAREILGSASTLADKVTAALDAALDAADDQDPAAGRRIGLCETALDLLAEIDRRLRHAIARLSSVPVVLGETYESVYDLIRAGGLMPVDGRWMTGEDDPGPAAGRRWVTWSLAALPGYLARHGWTRGPDHRGAQVWQLGSRARILVPPPGFADSADLAATALRVIAKHEHREPRDVLHDLAAGATRRATAR